METGDRYPAFDADNHYYEALDAFTRHLDPQARAALRAVVRHRRSPVPRGRRPGQPRRRQPDVRPDRQGRGDARVLPRQPGRQVAARVPPRPRADPGALPRTPRPAWRSWTSRASRRSGCSRRSACSTRSCSSTTSTAVTHDVHGVQPVARRRLGLATTQDRIFAAPYISLADVDWAVARARVGARPRCARRS